ncbi:MAG: tRNA (N(6)-L-threonylcarbamoyladenosine(37)-C(2))-methylthiotransferase MtaB [Bacteroidales bacterium]|nr:tRNA (N(6)-L-threonylcarbamoyladenosine(37)-C(2))-methylthiotransferase MtaB [Bacteroidales bacterium]
MAAKTFAIYTLGCKLNFGESSEIARQLTEAGLTHAEHPDVIILNSCAVTATAEKKSRNLVAHLHRETPDAEIVVLGCYGSLRPELIRRWPGVTAVFGNRDKMNAIPYILGETLPTAPRFFSAFSSNDRTRSFLKIQDGCDYHCSYCTVADARGESRSDTIDHVICQLQRINESGIKEVNLTGVNIGDFGKGQDVNFYQLLQRIEQESIVPRVRISSVEPNLLSEDIIRLVAASQTLMPHFHIPLQSGCNRILALMRRRYNRDLFAGRIHLIKELMPQACIAIDVIAGFPGETEEDFDDTCRFLESLPLSYMHVFTYSSRPGTPAATMPQNPPQVKKERTDRLLALSAAKKWKFYQENINTSHTVLFESEVKDGMMSGFTENYVKVQTPYNAALVNEMVPVKLGTPANPDADERFLVMDCALQQ